MRSGDESRYHLVRDAMIVDLDKLCDEYYVAYKPITLSYISYMIIEMKFIYCHSFVIFEMKSMSMCNE